MRTEWLQTDEAHWWTSRRDRLTVWGAMLALVAVLAALMAPASAGKPDKGGDSASTVQDCKFLNHSIDGADIRAGLNVPRRADGSGIDVAVIDTGITGVANTIDGPDLSFDGLNDELRNEDLYGHGSHMAEAIAGVAPGARLIDVKVGDGIGAVDVSQVIAAIDWVVSNKTANGMNIRVISLAYDTDADVDQLTDPLTHAVQNAWNHGIAVVVAGGNDGRSMNRLGNPALNPNVISVGATELTGGLEWKVPSWSSTGDHKGRMPDFVAPGANLLLEAMPGSYLATTYPGATCDNSGTLMIRGSGTSQASAVTAGAIAILLEDRPELTPNQVKYLLSTTATTMLDDEGLVMNPVYAGSGMINVGAALAAPTPSHEDAFQPYNFTTGLGSLDASRGTYLVGTEGDYLQGDTVTAFTENWDQLAWAFNSFIGDAWTGATWSGGTWSGGTWSGATWSGGTWSGGTWSGGTWSGATWSGATWSGATWSGATWSGATWSGATWSGNGWS